MRGRRGLADRGGAGRPSVAARGARRRPAVARRGADGAPARGARLRLRERVGDTHLPWIRELRARCRGSSPRRRAARATPASTASSCTTPTLHHGPSVAPEERTTATRSREPRVLPAARGVAAVRARFGAATWSASGSSATTSSRRQPLTRRLVGVRFAEARRRLPVGSKGGRFEDARQPKIGEPCILHRPSGTSACPPCSGRAGEPFGATCRWPPRFAAPCGPPPRHAGRDQRRHRLLRAGRAILAAARPTASPRAAVDCRSDWFRKIRLGYGHLVRRCAFTNYCEDWTSTTSRSRASLGSAWRWTSRECGWPATASDAWPARLAAPNETSPGPAVKWSPWRRSGLSLARSCLALVLVSAGRVGPTTSRWPARTTTTA